jgi:hypothetical protein
MERRVIMEVQQAATEYRVSRQIARRLRDQTLPALEKAIADRDQLFREGEVTVFD